jgi:hypothetical protein
MSFETIDHLIFQHIPKTAGTSIAKLFRSQFNRDEVFICGTKDGVLTNFTKLRPDYRRKVKLLIGHVDFGIHDYFDGNVKYFTFLRDPLDRVLSHYYYIRSDINHRYYNAAQKMDIDQFIEAGVRPRMNNCMVRMISGLNPPFDHCDESMLGQALENINNSYAFVGFFSSLLESVDLLLHQMNWRPIEVANTNPTKNKPDRSNVSKVTLDLIRKYNMLDIKFYNLMEIEN